MKIKVYESNSKKPYANTKVQLQVKGKDSGFLSFMTDEYGEFYFDDKYQGQQIALLQNGIPGQWFAAKDGLTFYFSFQTENEKEDFYK